MDLKELKRLSDGIMVLSQDMAKIIVDCQMKYEVRQRAKKKRKAVMICMAILLLSICPSIFLRKSEIAVYAATSSSRVLLQENERVVLAEQMTSMGTGYKLELVMPTGEYTYTVTDEHSQYPENIFHKDNEIYWMPDGMGRSLKDSNGNVIELPKISKSVINIQIVLENDILTTFQLFFEKNDKECIVTLIEVNK